MAATRLNETDYQAQRPLGRSVERAAYAGGVLPVVAFENAKPLPVVYNAALDAADEGDTLLFTHDDVRIDDWFLAQRLEEALGVFDVVGVAGNAQRTPRQWGWALGEGFDLGRPNVSGAVAHGGRIEGRVVPFGPTPAPARLMDGVFLAARVATLRRAGVRFDPRFKFHFYDLDFCRSCEAGGLRMGTWPIAITHASEGDYGSPAWKLAYYAYLAKWKE